MKYIILLLFILISGICNAQYDNTYTGPAISFSYTQPPRPVDTVGRFSIDTIKTMIIVADTSGVLSFIDGYEVRLVTVKLVDDIIDPNAVINYGNYSTTTLLGTFIVKREQKVYKHLLFLDKNKVPLRDGLIVWDSKPHKSNL
jgi:hypothetical protein